MKNNTKIKIILVMLVSILLIATSNICYAANEATFELTQNTTSFQEGDTIEFTLKLQSGSAAISGFSANLEYDSTILGEPSVSSVNSDVWNDVSYGNGKIIATSNVDNTETNILILKFKVLKWTNDTTVSVILKDFDVTNDALDDFQSNVINKSVKNQAQQGSDTQKTLTGLRIDGQPKTTYVKGQKVDLTGVKVYAVYNNEEVQLDAGYVITPNGELTVEDNKVTISYTENGVTKTATFDITVTDGSTDGGNGTGENKQDGDKKQGNEGANNENGNPEGQPAETPREEGLKGDETTAPKKIPAAGIKVISVVGIVSLVALAVVFYKKQKNLLK